MKKTVLCALNSKYIHSCLAPWCLFTACRKEGIDNIKVIEGTVNEKSETVLSRLVAEKAETVAFSCYIWNISFVLSLARSLKKRDPSVNIILGGPEVSYRQKSLLEENHFLDYIISGEGEESLPVLLRAIEKGESKAIPGVSQRIGGKTVLSREVFTDLSRSVSPYCDEYFQCLGTRIAYIESSRGCPYSCAFCLSGRCGSVRFIDLQRVKKELLLLSSHKAKIIKFVDRTFNCNEKRAIELLSFIKEEYGRGIDKDVCFHFEIAADIMSEKLFDIIRELPSGSVQFEAGIQSFDPQVLSAINRKNNIDKTEENIRRLVSLGNCHVHIDLIAGLPSQSYDSFVSSFTRAYDIGAHMLQAGFLKVLYGSPIGESPQKYPCRHSDEAPYEVIETPYMTKEDLRKLHICENELDRLYNSGRFENSLSYVTKKNEAFSFFLGFGEYLIEKGKRGSIPLDEYTCLAYEYMCSIQGVDPQRLRDLMVMDRLQTNSSDVMPYVLKRQDPALRKIRSRLQKLYPVEKGIKRSVAILYTFGEVVWCDYDKKDRVTSGYKLKTVRTEDVDL